MFNNVGDYVDATLDKTWIYAFRKIPAVNVNAGNWYDLSPTAGNPVPNYYASSPLTAATLDGNKGFYHGPETTGDSKKYLQRLMTVTGAPSATSIIGQNTEMVLLDYLLYYPFIDMDAVGDVQAMDNTTTLPRYDDGVGVMMMMVAQSTTLGSGQFTIEYVNQAGVTKTTPTVFCPAAQVQNTICSSNFSASGIMPFIPLADGDYGVRSINSVTFSVANGGLAAIVLVKPIVRIYQLEESRRNTTALANFGSPAEIEYVSRRSGVGPEIKNGAYLNLIMHAMSAGISSTQYTGILETVWS